MNNLKSTSWGSSDGSLAFFISTSVIWPGHTACHWTFGRNVSLSFKLNIASEALARYKTKPIWTNLGRRERG